MLTDADFENAAKELGEIYGVDVVAALKDVPVTNTERDASDVHQIINSLGAVSNIALLLHAFRNEINNMLVSSKELTTETVRNIRQLLMEKYVKKSGQWSGKAEVALNALLKKLLK